MVTGRHEQAHAVGCDARCMLRACHSRVREGRGRLCLALWEDAMRSAAKAERPAETRGESGRSARSDSVTSARAADRRTAPQPPSPGAAAARAGERAAARPGRAGGGGRAGRPGAQPVRRPGALVAPVGHQPAAHAQQLQARARPPPRRCRRAASTTTGRRAARPSRLGLPVRVVPYMSLARLRCHGGLLGMHKAPAAHARLRPSRWLFR